MRLLSGVGIAVSIAAIAATSCTAQDRSFHTFELDDGTSLTYSFFLPNNFDSERSYPVLVCPSDIDPDEAESWCWRGMTENHRWIRIGAEVLFAGGDGPAGMRALFDHLRDRFNVEGGKFHIVGFSANSGPTFAAVIADPDQYASVTGIPGHPRSNREEDLKKLVGIRVQLIVGSDDGYWLGASKQAETKLKELGVDVSLEIIPNGGHVLKSVFGDGLMERVAALRAQAMMKE